MGMSEIATVKGSVQPCIFYVTSQSITAILLVALLSDSNPKSIIWELVYRSGGLESGDTRPSSAEVEGDT